MKKSFVVFAPHPDDETLGCGGTIAKKLSEGHDAYIVFMTDGRHAFTDLGISSDMTPLELKETRLKEAMRATKILGLKEEEIFFLDFEDKTLKWRQNQAQERTVEILKDICPSEIYFPQVREYNTDHRATNTILRNAIAKLGIHPIQYQYVIAWSFPYNLLVHVMSEGTFDLFVSKFLKGRLIRMDISRFLPSKEMAIKEYRSQITVLSNGQKRPALEPSFLNRFLKNEETFFVYKSSE